MPLSRIPRCLFLPLALAACDDPATGAADAADVVTVPTDAVDVRDARTVADDRPATDAGVADDRPATDAGVADAGAGCRLDRVLVTTSNFMTGGYALGPRAMGALGVVGGMSPDQDHIPVQSGCVVYNLLRGNDVLAVLDPANLPSIARRIPLRGQVPDAGAGPYQVNPYDVLTLSPTKAYVVQFARARMAIVDPSRDGAGAIIGGIDLGPLRSPLDTDPNGSPEPVRVVRVGNRALVALQNLSAFAPIANGTLAVIDTTTDQLVDTDPAAAGVQGVVLGTANPTAMTLSPNETRVVVANVGVQAFSPPQRLDGAIEALDASSLRPTGMRITEQALGGDLGALVMLDENRGWVVVSRLGTDAGPAEERLVEFDLANGTVGRTVFTARSLAALARDPEGNVWVLDRSMGTEGVRVFAPDGTPRGPALGTGSLPPYGIAFVP